MVVSPLPFQIRDWGRFENARGEWLTEGTTIIRIVCSLSLTVKCLLRSRRPGDHQHDESHAGDRGQRASTFWHCRHHESFPHRLLPLFHFPHRRDASSDPKLHDAAALSSIIRIAPSTLAQFSPSPLSMPLFKRGALPPSSR